MIVGAPVERKPRVTVPAQIRCPLCGGDTYVTETRTYPSNPDEVVRKRRCIDLTHAAFKTVEMTRAELISLRLQVLRFNQIKALFADEIRQPVG